MPLQQHSAPYAHSVFTAENGDLIRVVPERGGLLTGWQVQGEIIYLDQERFLPLANRCAVVRPSCFQSAVTSPATACRCQVAAQPR